MGVAAPQEATFQVAELVEQEERVITGAAEVAIPDRAFLLAVGRALGTVHVEDDRARGPLLMHPVDPGTRQIRQRFQIGVRRQPLGLEAPHLAARCRRTVETLTADDGPHGGVAGEPLGVVDILVAGEAAEDRLSKQPGQRVARILAAAVIEELGNRDLGEPEGGVELAVREQATVGGDPGTVEFELDSAVESGSQRQLSGFTRRVPHDHPSSDVPSL